MILILFVTTENMIFSKLTQAQLFSVYDTQKNTLINSFDNQNAVTSDISNLLFINEDDLSLLAVTSSNF